MRAARTLAAGAQRSQDAYRTLFAVTIRHQYYNQSKGLCTDFTVAPTPATARLMSALGLLFRPDGAGFAVLAQSRGMDRLRAYVVSQATGSALRPEYWSRLTFCLSVTNPSFVGISLLPIDTKPTGQVLYACNTGAHLVAGTAVLSSGPCLDGKAGRPVTGPDLQVALPPGTQSVTVSEISGAVVIPPPGAPPVPDPPPDGPLVPAFIPLFEANASYKTAYIGLQGLPFDLYTINSQAAPVPQTVALATGVPVLGPAYVAPENVVVPDYPYTVAYVPSAPAPLVLLDMLFAQPTPGAAGAYPLGSLFDTGGAPDQAAYALRFDARATDWEYYVLPRDPLTKLSDLRIESLTRDKVDFQRVPHQPPLADGAVPVLLRSAKPLRLRQLQPQRFRLTARRTDASGRTNDIVVSPLPVPPPAPVWPKPGKPTSGRSEMFVYV